MILNRADTLPHLYEQDETAWLEQMVELIQQGRWDELDHANLSEFLSDMARRDKREVESRLAVLLAHLLKWIFQPERRCGSWKETIEVQRHELDLLLESGTLRNHADAVLASAYAAAIRQAAAETGLATTTFPTDCAYNVEQILTLEKLPD